jgi:hypothetical protein
VEPNTCQNLNTIFTEPHYTRRIMLLIRYRKSDKNGFKFSTSLFTHNYREKKKVKTAIGQGPILSAKFFLKVEY